MSLLDFCFIVWGKVTIGELNNHNDKHILGSEVGFTREGIFYKKKINLHLETTSASGRFRLKSYLILL